MLDSFKSGAKAMSLSDAEFRVLRETIATRGTVRMALLPLTMFGWAVIAKVASK